MDTQDRIRQLVNSNRVVLFMKGDRRFPQCGFSARAVSILKAVNCHDFITVNVLTDPELRQGIKTYADWPTIPQLYVQGEFIGGADIMNEMLESGELHSILSQDQS